MVVGYACVGTSNLAKAKAFYDELLAPLGAKITLETGRGYYYNGTLGGGLLVTEPFDGQPSNPGNGNTVGLVCPNRVMCDTMYNKALAMGCIDEGPVGPRGADHGDNTGLYIGYVRDPEGNKLAFYVLGPDA